MAVADLPKCIVCRISHIVTVYFYLEQRDKKGPVDGPCWNFRVTGVKWALRGMVVKAGGYQCKYASFNAAP